MDNYLTHYYHKNEKPFRTISPLSDNEALEVIERYDPNEALVYRRFKDSQKYLKDRRATESWLREEFIKIGGKPVNEYPYYLVLGSSSYIFDGYNGFCKEIQISLKDINLSEVSFTYPDSMVSYWLKEKKNKEYFQSKYHGKVFNFDQLRELSVDIKHEDNIWEEDKTRAYDFFIEAQLWSDDGVQAYM